MIGEAGAGPAGALFGDRFRLGALLGVGGSAAVYAAADTWRPGPDGRPQTVALKVLHPHLGGGAAAREAFLAEARAVQRLRHPNVAEVHDAGLDGSSGLVTAWLALDLVPGGSLADLLAAHGPLPPAQAVAVLDGVLAALGAAHAAGLVHRDVSPANVLLTEVRPDGPRPQDVRLVDFGLADAVGRDARGVHVLRATDGLTPDGDAADPVGVVGNALYLSPEHARGEPVGPAGDLYQVGALAHVLLTGCPPFSRDSVEQVLRAHLTAPPPAPSVLAPAARPLDRVVTRALQKDPADRYADAGEMRVALAAAVAGPVSWRVRDAERGLGGTRPLGAAHADDLAYLDAVADPAGTAGVGAPDRAAGVGAAVGVGIAAVLGVALWGVLAAGGPGGAAAPTPTASTGTTAAPVAEPTAVLPAGPASVPVTPDAEPTVLPVGVPVLSGTLADAQRALTDAGLTLGVVDRVPSPEAADRVLGQAPAAGQQVLPGSAVQVTVASGSSTVPQVAGMTVAGARAVLESAGFVAATDVTQPGPTATVSGSQPAAGAVLRVGVTVTLVVAAPAPTPAPTGGAPAQP